MTITFLHGNSITVLIFGQDPYIMIEKTFLKVGTKSAYFKYTFFIDNSVAKPSA